MDEKEFNNRMSRLKDSYQELPTNTDLKKIYNNIPWVEKRGKIFKINKMAFMSFMTSAALIMFALIVYLGFQNSNKNIASEDQQSVTATNENNQEIEVVEQEIKFATFDITVDDELYSKTMSNGNMVIKLKEPLPENYPDVLMEITQIPNSSMEQASNELFHTFSEEYENASLSQVEEPISATLVNVIGGTGGNQWDDPIINCYVLDNGLGGALVIKQMYFLEASEGHGTRFYEMLKTFKVINK